MQENEKKTEAEPTWKDIFADYAEAKKDQNVASEIIAERNMISKAKNVGMVCVTVITVVSIIGLLIVNHLNTRQFTEYLSNYDFVSQDGEGYNYYNSDIGGDVNNGAKDSETKGQG